MLFIFIYNAANSKNQVTSKNNVKKLQFLMFQTTYNIHHLPGSF